MIIVAGPLAHPQLAAALKLRGTARSLPGQLQGGQMAGIAADSWPQLRPGAGQVAALETEWTVELRRYAEIFGLQPQDGVLGLAPANGLGTPAGDGRWNVALAAAMAQWLVALDATIPAQQIRARLHSIALWVDSRLRGMDEQAPALGPAGALGETGSEWELITRAQPYGHFFSVESLNLRHRLNSGGWSDPLERAVFVSGDASVVLPWDPQRDRVLLVDQFRAAPAARGDREPWLYETVAGRIDPGETPEAAARREAIEEAGITLGQVIPGPSHYPSPGAVAEFLYLFIGIADLPDTVAGIGGLETEGEDIRSHLVSRSQLMAMVDAGQIRNGPLLVLALWLDRHADRIRAALDDPGSQPTRSQPN